MGWPSRLSVLLPRMPFDCNDARWIDLDIIHLFTMLLAPNDHANEPVLSWTDTDISMLWPALRGTHCSGRETGVWPSPKWELVGAGQTGRWEPKETVGRMSGPANTHKTFVSRKDRGEADDGRGEEASTWDKLIV